MTHRTIKSSFLAISLLFFFILDFASPRQADACSIAPTYNYWFNQTFEFDPNDLPPGIELNISYEYNPEGYFSFQNNTDKEFFLGLSRNRSKFRDLKQGDTVDQTFLNINAYPGTGIDPHAILPIARLNGESPFEVPESVPGPLPIDLILFHDFQVYRVPVTVTFENNPNFNPRMLYGPINAKSLDLAADVIFTGAALSEDNKLENGILYGNAVITVGSWLKGDGAEQVTFGYFGDDADCGEHIQLNQAYIFYINENGTGYRKVDSKGLGSSLWQYSPENIQSILDEVAQESITFEFEQTLAEAENGLIETSLFDQLIDEGSSAPSDSEDQIERKRIAPAPWVWFSLILLLGALCLFLIRRFI